VDDVDTVLAAWNAANPSYQATLDSGDGSQIPDADDWLELSGGVDALGDPIYDQSLNTTDSVVFDGLQVNGSDGGAIATAFRGRSWYGSAIQNGIGTGVEALPLGTFGAEVPFLMFTGYNEAVTNYNSLCFSAGFFPQVFMHTNGNVGIRTPDPKEILDVVGNIQTRNGAAATQIQVHNTYENTTNFERGFLRWSENTFCIGTDKGDDGGAARSIKFCTNDTTRLTIGSTGGLTLADAQNIEVGITTGTKIGTQKTQKLGFWDATPIAQPAAVADATSAATVITQLNALLSRLRTLGLIST